MTTEHFCGLTLINVGSLHAFSARDRLALMAKCASAHPGFLPVSPRQSIDVQDARTWLRENRETSVAQLDAIEGCVQTTISIHGSATAPLIMSDSLRARAEARNRQQNTAKTRVEVISDKLDGMLRAKPVVKLSQKCTQLHLLTPLSCTSELARRLYVLGELKLFDGQEITISGPWPCLAFHEVTYGL